MKRSALATLTALAMLFLPITPAPAAADSGTAIVGRVLDANGGLPVPGATVALDRGSVKVAATTTAADGTFRFSGQAPGDYTVTIAARGYQTTQSPDILVTGNEDSVQVQTAIVRGDTGLKVIGSTHVASRSRLQATTTITEHLDAATLQAQDYVRVGDALAAIPFVNGSTSSAIGDDRQLSFGGLDPPESATLVDGHPIGPIGAFGQGYDYQLSPFWGLSGFDVTLGSGATGLYGVATMAGAVDFQTINPTKKFQAVYTQGIGNFGKLMSGLQTTGTVGRLGYALAYGTQGTDGQLGPQNITQTGLLTAPNGSCPSAPDSLPSIKAVDIAGCTYRVAGTYVQKNDVAKLVYDLTRRTQVSFTTYVATDWADSTGNGDTDYNPATFVTYNANNALNSEGGVDTQTLPSGQKASCTGGFGVLNDSNAGYQCMSPSQYGQTFAGPAGGGIGRWHAGRNQDYHARITQQLGSTQLLLDGFVDNYGFENVKSITGPYFDDVYGTHGALASDEFTLDNNDATVGIYLQHQQHVGSTILNGAVTLNPQLDLTTTNYFVRDVYSPSLKFSLFTDLSLQRSHNTASTNFDPRVSFVFHPAPADVFRLTGGRSSSEPDPSLLFGPFTFGAYQSFNPSCGSGLQSIGSGSSPLLKPETANDFEAAYGHRFAPNTVFQFDAYTTSETNPLVSGTFPLSTVPANQMTPDLQQFVQKLQGFCGAGYGAQNLGVSTTFNAGSARYRGLSFSLDYVLARSLTLSAAYAIQSAQYQGIGSDILANNATLVNNAQFSGIPLRQGNVGLAYSNQWGVKAAITGYYVGADNGFNRGAYMFANFNAARTVGGVTMNLGVNNLFNSIAQQYGYVGLGIFHPENQFGTDQNAFDQGSEQFGLPYRQFWMTFTTRI